MVSSLEYATSWRGLPRRPASKSSSSADLIEEDADTVGVDSIGGSLRPRFLRYSTPDSAAIGVLCLVSLRRLYLCSIEFDR